MQGAASTAMLSAEGQIPTRQGDTMLTENRAEAARATVHRARLVVTLAALATLGALVFLLSHSASGNAAVRGPIVSTASTSLGRILVDSRGHTLYLFGKDRSGKSACSGQCATFWPPLIANGK